MHTLVFGVSLVVMLLHLCIVRVVTWVPVSHLLVLDEVPFFPIDPVYSGTLLKGYFSIKDTWLYLKYTFLI